MHNILQVVGSILKNGDKKEQKVLKGEERGQQGTKENERLQKGSKAVKGKKGDKR